MDIKNACFLFGVVALCVQVEGRLIEEKLYEHLLDKYNRDIIPIGDGETPVDVGVGLTLVAIVNFQDDVLTLDTWLEMEWLDNRLIWNPEEYDGIHKTIVSRKKLWIPDMTLYNRELTDHGQKMNRQSVVVSSNGHMFMASPIRLSAYCQNNATTFSASGGQYTCDVKIGSWIYEGSKMNTKNRSDNVDLSNYFPNNYWNIINTRVVRNVAYYDCCPDTPYPSVSFIFEMKRRYNSP